MAYEVVVEHLNHLGIVAEVCREIRRGGVARRPGAQLSALHRQILACLAVQKGHSMSYYRDHTRLRVRCAQRHVPPLARKEGDSWSNQRIKTKHGSPRNPLREFFRSG